MNYYLIGKIVNTHGIRGELKIISDSDFVEQRFKVNNFIFLKENNQYVKYHIVGMRLHKNFVLLKLNDFNNINEVLYLKNQSIYAVGRATLGENEYYYDDIIGFEVYDINDKFLGIFTKFSETHSCDVWFVEGPVGNINIPNRPEFVKNVDLKTKKIIIQNWEME